MHDPAPHCADFHLAQKCVEGDCASIVLLQKEFGEATYAFLRRSGADEADAREVVDGLWAEYLVPDANGRVRMNRYTGQSRLQTWLNTVAFNRLVGRTRERQRRAKLHGRMPETSEGEEHAHPRGEAAAAAAAVSYEQGPLLDLMRLAIERAFKDCRDEDFVMLQLAHSDQLKLSEIARMFGRSQATICRQLDRASKSLSKATMANVHELDPWIQLGWDDFMDLCRSASPECFGVVD